MWHYDYCKGLTNVISGGIEKLEQYQREAAGENHENDECLEVLVLDEPVHGAAESPPGPSSQRPVEPLRAAAGSSSTALWAALVRVLHKHHLHLPSHADCIN